MNDKFSKLQYFLTCKRIINLRLFADEYKWKKDLTWSKKH